MIFKNPPRLLGGNMMFRYLNADLWTWIRNLMQGLGNLNFLENFDSFAVNNLTIPAATEVAIQNQFRNRSQGVIIPSYRLIVRQSGNGVIDDGVTPWSDTTVFLRNNGASSVTITVIFFR